MHDWSRYVAMFIVAFIAVADDDLGARTLVKRVLMRAGHEVTTYDDGAPLVEQVRARHPDVVVTDNEMPVMTGLEVVQALHDDPDTAHFPVVLASGSVPAATAAEVLRDGDQLLPKPFTPAQLQHGVDAALAGVPIGHAAAPPGEPPQPPSAGLSHGGSRR